MYQIVPKKYDNPHSGVELPDTLISTLDSSGRVYAFKLTLSASDASDAPGKTLYVSAADFYSAENLGDELVFISDWMADFLGVEFGAQAEVEPIEDVPTADYIRLNPPQHLFDLVPDLGDFFTNYFENFQILQIGISYPIPFGGEFTIEEIKCGGVSMDYALCVDTDLEVDFAPQTGPPGVDFATPPLASGVGVPEPTTPPPEQIIYIPPTSNQFEAFTGTGYRLG